MLSVIRYAADPEKSDGSILKAAECSQHSDIKTALFFTGLCSENVINMKIGI